MAGDPRLSFVVAVRDVAALHLRATTDPAAYCARFLAVVRALMTPAEMAAVLRERLGPVGGLLCARWRAAQKFYR